MGVDYWVELASRRVKVTRGWLIWEMKVGVALVKCPNSLTLPSLLVETNIYEIG